MSKSVVSLSEEQKKYLKENHDPKDKKDPSELPPWVKVALIKRQLEGLSYDDAAKAFGRRSGGQLNKYAQSPAAHAWMEQLEPFLNDPLEMAKALLHASAAGVTIDRFVFLEMAKEVGDYVNGDKIAKDLQDRMGVIAKKQDSGAIQVKIQLTGGASLDAPVIEAEWEEAEG